MSTSTRGSLNLLHGVFAPSPLSEMSSSPASSAVSTLSRPFIRKSLRIAVVGTGGLAWYIAKEIVSTTAHQLIWLSRRHNPTLEREGFQIIVVNYNDQKSLEFALTGVDIVISTASSNVQLKLIDAAIRARVWRFAPAEFEGLPALRGNDSADRSKSRVLEHLRRNKSKIQYTAFVCGILYERFLPGGMAASDLGLGSRVSGEGDYLINCREMTAELPYFNRDSERVYLSMIAAPDVARFVVRALELEVWPEQLTMTGTRLNTFELLKLVARVRGKPFATPDVEYHDPASLARKLKDAQSEEDHSREAQLQSLVATQDGHYDFIDPDLNAYFPDVTPARFGSWLARRWADNTSASASEQLQASISPEALDDTEDLF